MPHSPRPPPRVDAELLDGSRYTLADGRGAITVLVVWSPDSLASRKSLGELQRFDALFARRGVRTLALATSGDPAALRGFLAGRGIEVEAGRLGAHELGTLPEQHLPLIYVFDRQGSLRGMHAGLFRLRDLESGVAPLLAE